MPRLRVPVRRFLPYRILPAASRHVDTSSVWPKILKDICAKKNIHVLE